MGYLKNSGFVILGLPQPGIDPLQLLVKTSGGTVEKLNASIDDLFILDTFPVPDVSDEQDIAEISGEEEVNINVSADAGFLKNLIAAFKLDGHLSMKFDKATRFRIKLESPKLIKVNVLHLASFISRSKLNENIGDFSKMVRDGELYVVTESVKARSFQVESALQTQAKGNVQLGIPDLAEIKSENTFGKKEDDSLHYTGQTMMTFAVKAYRITSSGGGWFGGDLTFSIKTADDLELVKEGTFHGQPLEIEEPYLKVEGYES